MVDCVHIDVEIGHLRSDVEKSFFKEVVTSLGGSLVDVELCIDDLRICFNKAKRKFIQQGHNSYRRVFFPIECEKGVATYPVPEEVDTVVKVISSKNGLKVDVSSGDLFDQITLGELLGGFGKSCNGYTNRFLEYEMALSQMETRKRYMSGDYQFKHDKFRNSVQILKQPRDGEIILLDCYVNLDDEEYMQIDWIVSWTVTEAKLMLGMAYRKFQSLAAPTGETNLSGSEYIQEAKEEQRMLLEDIEHLVDGDMDSYTVYIG